MLSFIICSLALRYQVSLEHYNNQKVSLILKIVKARSKQPSVTDSPYPKRQENVDIVATTLDKPQTRNSSFRDMCLKRDSYCCVVTGHMDTDYWDKTLGNPEGVEFARIEAAHIIPFAYASWDKSSVIYPYSSNYVYYAD
jgi:hypothetical protein